MDIVESKVKKSDWKCLHFVNLIIFYGLLVSYDHTLLAVSVKYYTPCETSSRKKYRVSLLPNEIDSPSESATWQAQTKTQSKQQQKAVAGLIGLMWLEAKHVKNFMHWIHGW